MTSSSGGGGVCDESTQQQGFRSSRVRVVVGTFLLPTRSLRAQVVLFLDLAAAVVVLSWSTRKLAAAAAAAAQQCETDCNARRLRRVILSFLHHRVAEMHPPAAANRC